MENTAPVRALNRRTTQLLQGAFVVFAVGALVGVIALFFNTIPLLPPSHPLFSTYALAVNVGLLLAVLLLLAALVLAVRALQRRRDNDLAALTGRFLDETGAFDGSYAYIRNINRPGLNYVDAVLLGPPGALVFRIIDERGSLANEGNRWMKLDKSETWLPLRYSPSQQVLDDVRSLRHYFQRKRLPEVPIFGVIVLAAGPGAVTVAEKAPAVPVSHLNTLVVILNQQYLTQKERVSQEMVTRIRRLLLN